MKPANRPWLSMLRVTATMCVVLLLQVPVASAEPANGSLPNAAAPTPPAKQPPATGLTSEIQELVNEAKQRGASGATAEARRRGFRTQGNSVAVSLDVRPGAEKVVSGDLRQLGAQVEATADGLIAAVVPAGALSEVPQIDSVIQVRRPFTPELSTDDAFVSWGALATDVKQWHDSGRLGAGVKVGVIDLGFKDYKALLGTDLPPSTDVVAWGKSSLGAEDSTTERHGTAVAEVVHDMAPSAQLYLARIANEAEFAQAVDWMVANGVDVINASLIWPGVGILDGLGPINKIVDGAVQRGVFWANAAGNHRLNHWSGDWNPYQTSTQLFPNNLNVARFYASSGELITGSLTWNDGWGDADQDFDLYLLYWNGSSWDWVAWSENYQDGVGGNDFPAEHVRYRAPATGVYGWVIYKHDATEVVNFDLLCGHQLEDAVQVAARSLVVPADNRSAGMMAVAAVHSDSTLAQYSSAGPTRDGRLGIDLTAPSGCDTAGYAPAPFYGTSASSPHVAGAAALMLESYPQLSAADLEDRLKSSALDMAAAGPDTDTGAGRLTLPPAFSTRYEQGDARIDYAGTWTTWTNEGLSGSSYQWTNSARGKATVHFTGTGISWITAVGPAFGNARVTLDGATEVVDLYAPSLALKQTAWSAQDLSNGSHTLTIEWLGTKNPASSGTYVGIDALDVLGELVTRPALGTFEQDHGMLERFGTWTTWANSGLSGGSYQWTNSARGKLTARFTGSEIQWITAVAPSFGRAKVTLDGVVEYVDLYDAQLKLREQVWSATGLKPDVTHTLTIEWTGTKNPASSGTYVGVDALKSTGTLVAQPTIPRYEQTEPRLGYSGTWTSWNNDALSGGSYAWTNSARGRVTAKFKGSEIVWATAVAPSYGRAKVTLDGVVEYVDLYEPSLKLVQKVWSATGLDPAATHTLTIEWTGTKNPASSGTYVGLDALDVSGELLEAPDTVTIEQDDSRLTRSGEWTTWSNSALSGGSYAWTNGVGGSALIEFDGTEIDWITLKGPAYGMAEVYVDGVLSAKIDLYSPTLQYGVTVWSARNLPDGRHSVLVRWIGRKNASSSNYIVGLDSFAVTGTVVQAGNPPVFPYTFEQNDPRISYAGTWTPWTNSSLSEGSYQWTNSLRGAAYIQFDGTYLDWISAVAPAYGIATVTVDGGPPQEVDLYSPSLAYQQRVWSSGTLSPGPHTVLIEWTGRKNGASTGTYVGLDALKTDGTLTQAGAVPLPAGMERL